MIIALTQPLGLRSEITQADVTQINLRDGKIYFSWLDVDGKVVSGGSQADIQADEIPTATGMLAAIEAGTTPTEKVRSVEFLNDQKTILQDKIEVINLQLGKLGESVGTVTITGK
jgi:hypothetical protein